MNRTSHSTAGRQHRNRSFVGGLAGAAGAGITAGLALAWLCYALARLTPTAGYETAGFPEWTTPASSRAPATSPRQMVTPVPESVTGRLVALQLPSKPGSANEGPTDPLLRRGLEVYATQCAVCHGPKGLGDGLASFLLYPKPRDYSQGQFRLTSVTSGLPTDEDLLQTLRRGMPGSAMPSWAHLPEADLKALVATVRYLAVQGKAAGMMERNKSLTIQRAFKNAEAVLASGTPIEIAPKPPAAEIDLALGRETYVKNCAACHGEDGTGQNKADLKDVSGFPISARDFTQGVFKGSPEATELAHRIVGGMPGSPMPASTLSPKELWSLVQYVQSLIKPGMQQRVEQRHSTFTARRASAGTVPSGPDDPAWAQVQPAFVPLMPLWWRDQRVEGVYVQALHNGRHVGVRLAWRDATANDLPTRTQDFTDGAAVQLASAADPPFFGMGGGVAASGVVNIWHWKASWQRDRRDGSASLDSMKDTYPDLPQPDNTFGTPQGDVFYTARGAGNRLSQPGLASAFESLAAKGMGTLTSELAGAQRVGGRARWKNDEWAVVFLRTIKAEHDGEIAMDRPGGLSIAFAVWDGAAGDRNGQKAVSIWHRLAFE